MEAQSCQEEKRRDESHAWLKMQNQNEEIVRGPVLQPLSLPVLAAYIYTATCPIKENKVWLIKKLGDNKSK